MWMLLRDGTRWWVDVRGGGPPILLIHGFTGSSDAWGEGLLSALARRRRVLAVDLVGHGSSDAPEDPEAYVFGRVVDVLAGLLDDVAGGAADVCGYSMGGRIALGLAVTHPAAVRSLVLESASPGLADPAAREERRAADAALAERIEGAGIERFVDEWMGQPLFAYQDRLPPHVRKRERERRLRGSPTGLARSLRGMGQGAQPPFWEDLRTLSLPVLLLTGADDVRYRDIASAMAAMLPDARARSVPGAGHAVHLEAPDDWLEAVLGFLS